MQSSLSSLFDNIQTQLKTIENFNGNSTDQEYQKNVRNCLNLVKEAQKQVESSSLFSSNEELDDISTTSLRYILLRYYWAELLSKVVETNLTIRFENLKDINRQYDLFLKQCEQLKLMDNSDIVALHRERPPSPKTRREEKISRFKKEKEMNSKFQTLLDKREKRRKEIDSGKVGNKEENLEEQDSEEIERELIVVMINIASRKTIETLQTTEEELKMLEHMQKMDFKLPDKKNEPVPKPKFQNVVILPNQREQLQSQVFRPDYTLPTMTLDQWANHLEEMEHEREREKPKPTREEIEKERRRKENPEEEEDSDEKVRKDRAWDDWKDTHGKGEGNKNDHYFKRT